MINDCLFSTNNFNAEEEMLKISEEVAFDATDCSNFFDNLRGSLTVNGKNVSFDQNKTSDNIEWKFHIKETSTHTLFCATLKNVGNIPVKIADISFYADITNQIKNYNLPRVFCWNSWDMSVKTPENRTYNFDNILHISSDDGTTFFIGYITLSRTFTSHSLKVENEKYNWSSKMDIGNFTLNAGETFNTEFLTVAEFKNPYTCLENWAESINRIYKPKTNMKPTVCFNVGGMRPDNEIYEKVILENLDAINEKMNGLGIEYVWTSQTNLKNFIPGNWLIDNLNEIPSGIKGLTEKMAQKGFKHGVWVSPFWFFKEAEGVFEEHKNHLTKNINGEPILNEMAWCWKYEDDDKPNYHYTKCTLDGTHPDTIKYVKDIFSKYYDMGIRYYMLDFLDISREADYFDKSLTPFQSGYNILKTIREVAGDDTHLQTAVSSSPGFTGIINAARIGRDFGEGRPIDRDELNDFKNATHVLHDMHYSNLKYFLINTACNYFTHQKTYMNDMNCLMIDSFPVSYSQFAVSLFGLYGSTPLVICGDIRHMRQDKLDMMKLVLPRTEYSAKPIDLFERITENDYSRVQVLNIKTNWDEYTVVGVFNADQTPFSLNLNFEKLGLKGEQLIYDFWNQDYRGVFSDSFPVTLLPESCIVLRFTKKRNYPWIIGTNMHIQQGAVEIKSLSWDENNMVLSGIATRPVGQKGSVIISAPRNLKLLNRGKCHIIKELLDHRLVIEVPIEFNTEEVPFNLQFEKWEFNNITPRGLMPYATIDELKEYMAQNYKRENTRIFE